MMPWEAERVKLGIEPEEYWSDLAKWALSKACNGWRRDRQCVAKFPPDAYVLTTSHPGCVRAQQVHDTLMDMVPVDPSPIPCDCPLVNLASEGFSPSYGYDHIDGCPADVCFDCKGTGGIIRTVGGKIEPCLSCSEES